jgi:hypothetical protein
MNARAAEMCVMGLSQCFEGADLPAETDRIDQKHTTASICTKFEV